MYSLDLRQPALKVNVISVPNRIDVLDDFLVKKFAYFLDNRWHQALSFNANLINHPIRLILQIIIMIYLSNDLKLDSST